MLRMRPELSQVVPKPGLMVKKLMLTGLFLMSNIRAMQHHYAFGISAIGAFARVPKSDGTGFVSCFIIALDMPLGGPPFFFINGLVGGLGQTEISLAGIDEVEITTQILGGFSDPWMVGKQSQIPIKYGSFWFALGLKFKTVEIMELEQYSCSI